jgi:hypothetical protein
MTVLNKKCRMISFRLTADEYTDAMNRCAQHGFRSVSALARTATLGVASGEAQKPAVNADEFLDMQDQIFRLRNDLDRISALLPCAPAETRGTAAAALQQ